MVGEKLLRRDERERERVGASDLPIKLVWQIGESERRTGMEKKKKWDDLQQNRGADLCLIAY